MQPANISPAQEGQEWRSKSLALAALRVALPLIGALALTTLALLSTGVAPLEA